MIEIKCVTCGNQPSFNAIRELSKAQSAYNNLFERYEILHKFIRQIVHEWECDPNHAAALLDDVERLSK